jgi:hypothetical protein
MDFVKSSAAKLGFYIKINKINANLITSNNSRAPEPE